MSNLHARREQTADGVSQHSTAQQAKYECAEREGRNSACASTAPTFHLFHYDLRRSSIGPNSCTVLNCCRSGCIAGQNCHLLAFEHLLHQLRNQLPTYGLLLRKVMLLPCWLLSSSAVSSLDRIASVASLLLCPRLYTGINSQLLWLQVLTALAGFCVSQRVQLLQRPAAWPTCRSAALPSAVRGSRPLSARSAAAPASSPASCAPARST